MLVGHYSVSYAVKAADRTIPLWLLFLAVQLVDVFWAIFILLGIEKARIVPGITASNPFDLYYMPYTHSLVAAFVWAAVAVVAYRVWRGGRGAGRAAALVGVAVLSHWVLDLVVHRPDLPLWDDAYKVGLGLWDYAVPAFLLEGGLLFAGIFAYLRTTRPVAPGGGYGMIVFGLVMLAVQASIFFGPTPPSTAAVAVMALVSYFAFAGVAYWLERKRGPTAPAPAEAGRPATDRPPSD